MVSTTVRLDESDAALLAELADAHGGRSTVIRQALRSYASQMKRKAALADFLETWASESGEPSSDEVARMHSFYDL